MTIWIPGPPWLMGPMGHKPAPKPPVTETAAELPAKRRGRPAKSAEN